jgi:hypothetical protein
LGLGDTPVAGRRHADFHLPRINEASGKEARPSSSFTSRDARVPAKTLVVSKSHPLRHLSCSVDGKSSRAIGRNLLTGLATGRNVVIDMGGDAAKADDSRDGYSVVSLQEVSGNIVGHGKSGDKLLFFFFFLPSHVNGFEDLGML